MRVPGATYRVQFTSRFQFKDAVRLVPYLHELGITDLYASPILKARAGSTHGYDVTDPEQLNPELGGAEEFEELVQALRERHMGLLLDIVPNHMAASVENPWWFDVLEKGESSPYASWFDIDWAAKKLLLPILGKPYGEALENNELKLRVEDGRVVLQYFDQKLPIAAGGENLDLQAVDPVLSRQHYRVAYWQKTSDAVNYRRFFDVNELVGLRAEKDEVFQATHALISALVSQGKVNGLRIDHIDGLLDPAGYLRRLPDIYVVVEKILAGHENIPGEWQTQGTTGYDFLNSVNTAFVDPHGYQSLEHIYSEFTGLRGSRSELVRSRKRQVAKELFGGEVAAFVRRLSEMAEKDRHARDLRIDDLKEAFIEVTACLPVYRTYIRDFTISEIDRARILDSISVAASAASAPACSFLRRVLLLEPEWYLNDQRPSYLDFVMKWQQFTGPIMAKGLEDTAFYVHNALISLNEVGADPSGPETHFGVEQFHRRNRSRQERWPRTMNASSTHDTKRSEDVRSRINVLSELSEEWSQYLKRWSRANPSESAPDRNEQVLIYQTMLGAWPIDATRLKRFVTKALREAKVHTSWIRVNEAYENRVSAFVDRLLESDLFLRSFARFEKKIARFGALSSLSQLVLKITSPGIPDFYRGTETWDFSLTDPDNRRPVDFINLANLLEQCDRNRRARTLLNNWEDGRIKMFLTREALRFRRSNEALFLHGEYIPLLVAGTWQDHVIAFGRRLATTWTIVAVPRLIAKRGNAAWNDTRLVFPPDAPQRWLNIFTGEEPDFDSFPYMILTPANGSAHKVDRGRKDPLLS
jgi:(1->4)-alpha-D-glucan 1-alpha-D-glucosylmutase